MLKNPERRLLSLALSVLLNLGLVAEMAPAVMAQIAGTEDTLAQNSPEAPNVICPTGVTAAAVPDVSSYDNHNFLPLVERAEYIPPDYGLLLAAELPNLLHALQIKVPEDILGRQGMQILYVSGPFEDLGFDKTNAAYQGFAHALEMMVCARKRLDTINSTLFYPGIAELSFRYDETASEAQVSIEKSDKMANTVFPDFYNVTIVLGNPDLIVGNLTAEEKIYKMMSASVFDALVNVDVVKTKHPAYLWPLMEDALRGAVTASVLKLSPEGDPYTQFPALETTIQSLRKNAEFQNGIKFSPTAESAALVQALTTEVLKAVDSEGNSVFMLNLLYNQILQSKKLQIENEIFWKQIDAYQVDDYLAFILKYAEDPNQSGSKFIRDFILGLQNNNELPADNSLDKLASDKRMYLFLILSRDGIGYSFEPGQTHLVEGLHGALTGAVKTIADGKTTVTAVTGILPNSFNITFEKPGESATHPGSAINPNNAAFTELEIEARPPVDLVNNTNVTLSWITGTPPDQITHQLTTFFLVK